MSGFSVDIVKIDEIKTHPNADKLDIAVIGGFQAVVQKEKYKAGDRVVYFAPDTIIPGVWAENYGVTSFTQKVTHNGQEYYRIRQCKLRGEPSFGLVVDLPHQLETMDVGADVSIFYGAEKYVAPIPAGMHSVAMSPSEVPDSFVSFTDIENMRKPSFASCFEPGEEVIVTEKIHGTQVKLALIRGTFYASSKSVHRKWIDDDVARKSDYYWLPVTYQGIRMMMLELAINRDCNPAVQIFGETYGRVQSLRYGKDNEIDFILFGISLDGKFMDRDQYTKLCDEHGVKYVPEIYRGPYSFEKMKELSSGKSILAEQNGADHLREGIVVQPVKERTDAKLGRVILKFVSDDYLLGKHGQEDTTDH